MERVLIAVDDSKGSVQALRAFLDVFSSRPPREVLLLYIEKIEGRSLMDEMLGKAEMSTLKEELKGTEYQEKLDERARKVLAYFTKELADKGIEGVRSVVREGHPAEEILQAAKEEEVELIVVGSRGKRLHSLMMGSVSREVANNAATPVLLAK
jgi:nucleotide-binding universal stress UspA family protein